MSFDAGAIVGSLGLNISEYARGMVEAEGIAGLFPHAVTEFLVNPLLGVVTAAKEMATGLKDAFLEVARNADNMGELAEKAGVTVQFLTSVGKVAADSGSSVEGLADSMKFLGKNLVEALGEGDSAKAMQENFAKLGISVGDLKASLASNDLEGLFFKIGDGVKGLGSSAEKTKSTMELLGRGGTEMIPTFNKGSEEIKKMQAQLIALGGTVDEKEAAIGDKWGTLETLTAAAFEGIKKAFTQPFFEAFGSNAEEVTQTMINFAGTIRGAVTTAMDALMPLVKGIWEAFKGLGNLVGSVLKPAFELLVPVLKVVAELFGFIFEVIGKILGVVGSVVTAITDAVGITDPSQRSAPTAEAGGKAGGGGSGVNVENINVAAVDVDAASSAMAAKIAPQIKEAQRGHQQQIEKAAKGAKVARAVRGK